MIGIIGLLVPGTHRSRNWLYTTASFWTLGSYDIVSIFEAPDDASMAALQASIGAAGNIRTVTLRAFSQAEMNAKLAKLG